jgi:1,6-anhydro-N-acetylmuramate kinase
MIRASRTDAHAGVAVPEPPPDNPSMPSSPRPGPTLTADDRAPRTVVGTMTGTSVDGIDVAVTRIDGAGLSLQASLLALHAEPFPAGLRDRLRGAAEQRAMTAGEFARLAYDFGLFHATTIAAALAGRPADLAVVHGQTVFHGPPVSWQLLQPAPIAAALRCPVLFDLRQADLAAGGQGAPITPLADWVLFRGAADRAIVNLGGFANATFLPGDALGLHPESVRGGDLCACNQVLDAVARRALGRSFDPDGAIAASGRSDAAAVAELGAALDRQRREGRSLGTGDEAAAWVERQRTRLAPADLAASAAAAIGAAIGAALGSPPDDGGRTAFRATEAFVAGGGARHRPLVEAIARAAGVPVRSLAALGIPIEAREAVEMAVLGALSVDGVSVTLPAVTGRGPVALADGALLRPQNRVFRTPAAEA